MTYVLVQVKIEGTRFAKKNNFATLQKVRSGLAGVLPRPKERVSLHTKGLYTEIPQQLNTTYMYNTITCQRVYIQRSPPISTLSYTCMICQEVCRYTGIHLHLNTLSYIMLYYDKGLFNVYQKKREICTERSACTRKPT